MNRYQEGSLIRFTVVFRDPETNELIDPGTVAFNWRAGNFPPTDVITYTDDTVPSVGVIARLSLGTFETFGDSTGVYGDAIAKWRSTGVGQATELDPIAIDRNPF